MSKAPARKPAKTKVVTTEEQYRAAKGEVVAPKTEEQPAPGPTQLGFRDGIREVEAWAKDMEGFVKSHLEYGDQASADAWNERVTAIHIALRALKRIEPFQSEVKALIVRLEERERR